MRMATDARTCHGLPLPLASACLLKEQQGGFIVE